MKIALVDDDQKCLDEMSKLINDFNIQFQWHAKAVSFSSGETFLEAFAGGGFSAVFMDVYMDGIDGVAAALKMRDLDRKCILVFLTSSTEFMPQAFSCHAFEYITKPFSPRRVFQVLTEILEELSPLRKYIEVVSERKNVRIFLDEITSVVTDAHYLDISLLDGRKLHCRMTMTEFIKLTDGDTRFLSVNKGISVNAGYILTFEDSCCVLENGTKLPIRVRNRLKIEQAARDYNFEKIRSQQRRRND